MTQTKAELLQTRHQGDIRLGDADSTHYVGFKAPATVGSNLVWTLPATDGSADQFLQTNASGVLSWGTVSVGGATGIDFNDNVKARWGTGNDLEIFHDSNHSYITNTTGDLKITDTSAMILATNSLRLKNGASDEIYLAADNGSDVALYFNNSKKFETTNTGIAVTGAATISTDLTVTGDLTVSGTTTTINTQTLDVEDKNVVIGKVSSPSDTTADGGGWTLKGATDKTFNWVNATDSWTSSEHINLLDNKQLKVGTDADLLVYFDGTKSVIHGRVGDFHLRTNDGSSLTHEGIILKPNGAAEIYWDNSKKLETTSGGINVTGAINVNGSPLAGGNTTNLVADGAIAAGKPVVIKTNGKAAQVVSTSNTTGSTSMWPNSTSVKINEQSSVRFPCIVYDPNNEFAVQLVSQGGADLDFQCLTLNSSGAVTGTAGSNTTISSNSDEMHACWDETGDRVIVAYRDTNDGKGKILSGRFTSASAMSWSGPFTFENSSTGMCNVCHDTSSGKTLICYRLQSGSYMKVKTMTISYGSNDTASFGNRTDIDNSGSSNNQGYWPRAIRVAANKFVIGYNDYQSSGTYAYVIVASLSGTSVSCAGKIAVSGSSYKTAAIDYGGVMDLMYDTHNDKLITTYIREDDYQSAWGRVGSISGTSISWDAAEKRVTIWQGNSNQNIVYVRTVYEPHGKRGYMFYIKNTNSGNAYDVFWGGRLAYDASDANKLDVTNHDHPANTPSNLDQMMGPTALGNRGVILVPVNSDDHTNRNYTWSLISLTSTTVTTNANANNVIGFAEDAISDTATGTINLPGNIVGNQSSLTTGTVYYVQANGTLSTTQDNSLGGASGGTKAGIALSSTSLLISDYKAS